MQLETDPGTRNRAKRPHNLFMLNLAVFHLLMTPAAIALNVGRLGLLLPLLLSLSTIAFTYFYSRKMAPRTAQFEYLHWRLALRRYKYLVIAYAVTAALMLLGHLLAMGSADHNMQEIMDTVFIRIAIMPVLLTVMANFYLESNAISMAGQGIIPDAMLQQQDTEMNTSEQ